MMERPLRKYCKNLGGMVDKQINICVFIAHLHSPQAPFHPMGIAAPPTHPSTYEEVGVKRFSFPNGECLLAKRI